MEFVEGESLDRKIVPGVPLPAATVCDWVRQRWVCSTRSREHGSPRHQARQPHPHAEGRVKVLDFGLARFAYDGRTTGRLTQTGGILGTPDYMAPEQAVDAVRADVRADIYSLGCTFYHLLAGRPPFPEGTSFQKLLAHQQRPPDSITGLRPDVPAAGVRGE
jgi:serine/threonine protein kinase